MLVKSNTRIREIRGAPRVYGIDYKNWILEPEYCGTYQLISPAQVLTYVQNEEASLIYLNETRR
jgi:hypothetical protein